MKNRWDLGIIENLKFKIERGIQMDKIKQILRTIGENLPGVVRSYPWSAGALVLIGVALGAWYF